MMEFANRSALYVIPRQPFKDWAANYNEEPEEELQARLNEKRIYLIDWVLDFENLSEAIGPYYLKIFEYELMTWNSYKHEWPEDRSLDVFLEWFEVILCDDIIDLETGEIITEPALDFE